MEATESRTRGPAPTEGNDCPEGWSRFRTDRELHTHFGLAHFGASTPLDPVTPPSGPATPEKGPPREEGVPPAGRRLDHGMPALLPEDDDYEDVPWVGGTGRAHPRPEKDPSAADSNGLGPYRANPPARELRRAATPSSDAGGADRAEWPAGSWEAPEPSTPEPPVPSDELPAAEQEREGNEEPSWGPSSPAQSTRSHRTSQAR
jgi:hypothetical protein